MLLTIDNIRREATLKLDQGNRPALGQYLTPVKTAEFMASMFGKYHLSNIDLLDAGAGVGSLTIAFLERLLQGNLPKAIAITSFEIDSILVRYLNQNISHYKTVFADKNIEFRHNMKNEDFIEHSNLTGLFQSGTGYTHAILNPPYKKINSDSLHRRQLRAMGIETVNLYSAFVALSLLQLKDKGELVAIIPRSFCNGNYYKPFRDLIFKQAAIKQIHLFDSRTQAFKDDGVLQENIIIHLVKGEVQGEVKISRSNDEQLSDFEEKIHSFHEIVLPNDEQGFIYIPHQETHDLRKSDKLSSTLQDIDVEASTGPVVDFRFKDYLSMLPSETTVPLLYPIHFNGSGIDWPKKGKKPNAIAVNSETIKMLYPKGFYVLVRRFSCKEEKQRIVARVVDPRLIESEYIGIENHLNVFHSKKAGLDENLSYGLAAYLNSKVVDEHFRSFNGHTQVNVTDLKQLRYPNKSILIELGKWAKTIEKFDPEIIEAKIRTLL
jgi:adenine-specific DNA-methyltransferase